MNRLYTVPGILLMLGGVAALIGQAWALGLILLVVGGAGLGLEIRARKAGAHVPLQGGPDAGLERAKAQGLQNAQTGANLAAGGSGTGF